MRRFLAGSLLILICHGLMVAVPDLSATGTEEIKGVYDQLKQLMKVGDYEDALPVAETLVRLFREYFGGDDPQTGQALQDYADICENLGKTDEAEGAMREALRITEEAFGKESQRAAAELNDLGEFYKRLGRYNESEPLLKRALQIHEKLLGLDNEQTVICLNNLGELYKATRNYTKAEPLLKQAFQVAERVLGLENDLTIRFLSNLGLLFQAEGQYAEAESLLQRALQIRQKVLGPEHPDTAASLDNLALLYVAKGEYAKAEPLLKQALQIREKVFGPFSLDTGASLEDLGELYRALAEYTKAEPLFERALNIARKALGPEHLDIAAILDNFASVYEDESEYAKAEPLLLEALQIRERVLGPDHPDTAWIYHDLGLLYEAKGEYAKAEPLVERALSITRKALGPKHPDTATDLITLALLYEAERKYAKAEPLLKQGLQIRREVLGPEHPDTASSLDALGNFYVAAGEYAIAEPLLEQVLPIRQKVLGPKHPDTATSMRNLAVLYTALGEYAKAEPLLEQALQIRREVLGPEHWETAESIGNLASFYENLGDYPEAEPLFKQALEIDQKILGPQHPDTATSLNNLAGLYSLLEEYSKAEPLYQQALQIWQSVFDSDHPLIATGSSNLASLYARSGEYAKAEPLFQKALQIREKALGPEHPDTASSLGNLASLYQVLGQYAKAEPLFQQALRVQQKVLLPNNPYTIELFGSLALVEFELRKANEAERLARLQTEGQIAVLTDILSFTSEQQRLDYLNVFHPYRLFPFLKGSDADLALAILRFKGLVLDSVIEDRMLAEGAKQPEYQELLEKLQQDRRELSQLRLQPPQQLSSQANNRIQELEQELKQIEGQFAQHATSPGHARDALGVTLKQVQMLIPKDGVLVEFLRYSRYGGEDRFEPEYGAIVLCSEGVPLWITLGPARNIENLVKHYQSLVRDSSDENEVSANLQALSQALWAPIEKAMPVGTKQVIVSPDQQLNFVSFATLLSSPNCFVAEKYRIQYVTSGRDLLRKAMQHPTSEVALFAAPNFFLKPKLSTHQEGGASAEETARLFAREKKHFTELSFGPLAGTQKEGTELSKAFDRWNWKANLFTGERATKAALFELHSPYILHLATHGFFAQADPSDTESNARTFFALGQSLSGVPFFNNPMNLSGVALAGAQSTLEAWARGERPPRDDDGIVTAEDVSTLDLRGTWLVTLSACDTGWGETKAGEGVMGLRRGFIEAGAQNVLMTLWQINDDVTVEIIKDFYEAAHSSGNAQLALAEVQRDWLVQLRDGKGEKFERIKEFVNGPGLGNAVRLAGAFIMNSQGKP